MILQRLQRLNLGAPRMVQMRLFGGAHKYVQTNAYCLFGIWRYMMLLYVDTETHELLYTVPIQLYVFDNFDIVDV